MPFPNDNTIWLDQMAREIHETNKEKGFWDNAGHAPENIDFMLAKLALIHSEISETLEAMRKRKGFEAVEEELADIMIRLLDFVEGAKLHGWISTKTMFTDIVWGKSVYNKDRPHKHGNLI